MLRSEINKKFSATPKKSGPELILEYYIILVLFLYPMFMNEGKILSIFSQKKFLYYVVTICSVFLCILLRRPKKRRKRINLSRFDILLIIAFVFMAIRIFVKIFQKDMTYEQEIFLCILVISYFLIKIFGERKENYLNLLLLSAIPICLESVSYMLNGTNFVLDVSSMFDDQDGSVTFFLLMSCAASVIYCNENRDKRRKIYLIIVLLNYFVVLLQNNLVAICLTGLFLISIPIVFPATVTLVKRNLLLCFVFLFALSSIPFLQYAEGILLKDPLEFRYCVYIDFFIAFAGVFICRYLEKVPKDVDPNLILMKKFQKWYRWTIAVVFSSLSVCILLGNRLEGLPEQFGVKTWKIFGISLQNSIYISKGVYQKFLEDYGIVGFFLWIFLTVLIMENILKKWKQTDTLRRIYFSLSVLFLIQSFFYQLQPVSTPAFWVIFTLALTENQKIE